MIGIHIQNIMSQDATENFTYECSVCGLEYPDERLVRTHISLSSDSNHTGMNGVMSEAVVNIIDESGSTIEQKSGSGTIKGESMDDDIPDDVFPPSMSGKQLAIVRTAVRNHNVDSIKEIERRVNDMYDIDASYSTVRRTLRDYYIVDEDEDEKQNPEYIDLTPKQRAIVDIMASKQELSPSKQSNIVGASTAYIYNVKKEFPSLIDSRSDELVKMPEPQWTDDQIAVVDYLSEEDDCLNPNATYSEIADSVGVTIDVVSTLIHGHKHSVVDEVGETTVTTDEPEKPTDESIMSYSDSMSATPQSNSQHTSESPHDTDISTSIEESMSMVEHIEGLQQEVRMYREIAEERLQLIEDDCMSTGQYIVAKRIEEKLDKIIQLQ